jgi:hypothetical protein
MSNGLEHPPHLSVTTFAKGYLNTGLVSKPSAMATQETY